MWLACFLLPLTMNAVAGVAPVVKMGSPRGSSELAFKYAVYRINKERSLLPNSTLVYDIQYTTERDTFNTYKKSQIQLNMIRLQVQNNPSQPIIIQAQPQHSPQIIQVTSQGQHQPQQQVYLAQVATSQDDS